MSTSLRIIFAGTPKFAASHLNSLLNSKHQVVGVLTRPDYISNDGKKVISTPVKILAKKQKLPIFQLNPLYPYTDQQIISRLNADIMVVVAYGLILAPELLQIPRLGCINVHGSLLPRWRGAAPVQRSLLAGDIKTGITIIQMDSGIDTGNILNRLSCKIDNKDTSVTLFDKLEKLGQQCLIKTLHQLSKGNIYAKKQDDAQITYAKKINRNEARINWLLPAVQLERCVRAFNPWPVSWFETSNQPIKIWKASVIKSNLQEEPGTIISSDKVGIQIATGDDILNLESLQIAGRKAMNIQDILNSRRNWFIPGNRLT